MAEFWHPTGFFGRNADVPMMIIAVGEGERIARVLPELGGLLRRPLITLERVRVCKPTAPWWPRRSICRAPTSRGGHCGRS